MKWALDVWQFDSLTPQKASESHIRQIADMSPIRIVETEVPSLHPRQDLSLQRFMSFLHLQSGEFWV